MLRSCVIFGCFWSHKKPAKKQSLRVVISWFSRWWFQWSVLLGKWSNLTIVFLDGLKPQATFSFYNSIVGEIVQESQRQVSRRLRQVISGYGMSFWFPWKQQKSSFWNRKVIFHSPLFWGSMLAFQGGHDPVHGKILPYLIWKITHESLFWGYPTGAWFFQVCQDIPIFTRIYLLVCI